MVYEFIWVKAKTNVTENNPVFIKAKYIYNNDSELLV